MTNTSTGAAEVEAAMTTEVTSDSTHLSVPQAPNTTKVRLWTVTYCAVTAYIMSLLLGSTLSYSSPALLELTSLEDTEFRFNTHLSDIFGASPLIGAVIGGPVGGWIVDRWGRKTSLVLNSVPYFYGYFIILSSYLAKNGVLFKVLLVVGRFFTGVGIGWAYVAVPVYIGEISPAHIRGIFTVCTELSLAFGSLLMFALGSIPKMTYYNLALVLMGILAAYIFMVVLITETPRWLLLKRRDKRQVLAVLRCLRGPRYHEIQKEFDCIESSITRMKPSFSEVLKRFSNKCVLIPFSIVLSVYVFQQLCGAIIVTSYIGLIFRSAGVANPNATSIYTKGGASLVGVILASLLIDVAGRKILLSISAAGMFVSSALLGGYFYITRLSLCVGSSSVNATESLEEIVVCNPHLSPMAIVSLLLFCLSFSVGAGPVPWVLLCEYLPCEVKGVAGGVLVAANWCTAAAMAGTFLSYSELVGAWFAWWTLSIIHLVGFFVIITFVVETKGKSLEDVQELFKDYKIFRCTLCVAKNVIA